MRRVAILLALLTGVTLVMSAAIAEAATRTVINCATEASSDGTCTGTSDPDKLLDEPYAFTEILGRGGNDLYVEYSGGTDSADTLHDSSSTSSDIYKIANRNFVRTLSFFGDALWIIDDGGSDDVLNLKPTGYDSTDCSPSRINADGDASRNDLFIDCPGRDNTIVFDYYTTNSIERFRFADGTFTLPKNTSASNTSQAQEQTSEPSRDGKHSSEVVSQQAEARGSSDSWQKVTNPER